MQSTLLKKNLLICLSVFSISTVMAETPTAEGQTPVRRGGSPLKTLAMHVNELKRQVKDLRQQIADSNLTAQLADIQSRVAELESHSHQDHLANAVNELLAQVSHLQQKVDQFDEQAASEPMQQIAGEMEQIKSRIEDISLRLSDTSNDNSIAYLAMQVKNVQGQVAQMNEENAKTVKRTTDYDQDPVSLSARERGRLAPFYVTGELLYWKLSQGGMEYAVDFDFDPNHPAALGNAKAKDLDFGYDFGYRVGLGYNIPCDGWDAYASYTFFRTDEHKTERGTLFPYLSYQGQTLQSYAEQVKAHWSVKLKNINVEIGADYYFAKHFSLRPNMGFKAAKINQNVSVRYSNLFINGVVNPTTFRVSLENEFKGIGPRLGLDSYWHMGAGFSLFGDVNASILAGWFDVEQTQKQFSYKEIDLESKLRRYVPVLELQIGLAWDYYFHRDKFHFGWFAAYEAQYWWRQNQIEYFGDSLIPSYMRFSDDLTYGGLSAGIRFDF